MKFCTSCGTALPPSGECTEECRKSRSTIPAPDADLDALLEESRPTPINPFDPTHAKTVSTMRAPEDGAVIDVTESDIDLSELTCPQCGEFYEESANFCASCGKPRTDRRTTEPYVAARKPGSIPSAPVPKFDPPPPAFKDPTARKPPMVSQPYSIIKREETPTAPPKGPRRLGKTVVATVTKKQRKS